MKARGVAEPQAGEGIGRLGRHIVRFLGVGALVLAAACQPRPPLSRMATVDEASPELVVVNYAPRRLRVLPIGTDQSGYLLLGGERPLLPAVFRPLGVTTRKAPAAALSRAGELAWVGDHVVEAPSTPVPSTAAPATPQATLLVYDRDSKVATPTAVALPQPCTQTRPVLLHSDGRELYALVRCAAEDTAIVLRLSSATALLSTRVLKGAGAAELFVHQGDVDYLLVGPKVVRADAAGQKVSPPLPAPGSPETRELIPAGSLLLVVDGGAGRVTALDSQELTPKFERRLYFAHPVTRLRATLGSPDRLLIVVAERPSPATATTATELVALVVPLAAAGPRDFPPRVLLGSGGPTSDHELVPIATSDGGGALVVRTHAGNSGPLVALFRLNL